MAILTPDPKQIQGLGGVQTTTATNTGSQTAAPVAQPSYTPPAPVPAAGAPVTASTAGTTTLDKTLQGLGSGSYTTGINTGYQEREQAVDAEASRMMGQDSILMQKASAQGAAQANARGLGNSSMAVTASQSAMLDQIVPMASQNAQQNFQRNLSNQQANENSALSKQDAGQKAQQSELDYTHDAKMSDQDYRQTSNLSTQDFQQQSGLSRQGYQQDSALSRQDYDQTSQLAKQDFGYDTELMKLDFRQKEALAKQGFDYEKILQDDKQAFDKMVADMQLDVDAARNADTSINQAWSDFNNRQSEIMRNTDLTAEQREEQLDAAREDLKDRMVAVNAVYGNEYDYDMKSTNILDREGPGIQPSGGTATSGKWPGSTWENGDTPKRGDTRVTANGVRQVYQGGEWVKWGS